MSCAACVSKIESSVKLLPGITACNINLLFQTGAIQFDANIITKERILKKIQSTGFTTREWEEEQDAEDGKAVLKISNMTNEEEAELLKKSLFAGFPSSITNIAIQLKTKEVTILYDSKYVSTRYLIKYLHQHTQFKASIAYVAGSQLQKKKQKAAMLREKEIKFNCSMFWISVIFTVPLMVITMLLAMIPGPTQDFFMQELTVGLTLESLLAFLLATPVQFICGAKFYFLAFKVLRHGSTDMNVLIVLGATEAYVFSIFSVIYAICNPGYMAYHYFETSAALFMFLLLGRWLESIAKKKTSQALLRLMDMQPTTALLLDFENLTLQQQFETQLSSQGEQSTIQYTEVETEIGLVQKNDLIKIVPGAKIPVDGVVVFGYSSVNESMITGESLPQSKSVDHEVIGGTINVDGLLIVKATRLGKHSTLSIIQRLVENAQVNKPKIQDLANKISGLFVPSVITLSVIVFGIWLVLGFWNLYPSSWRPSNMDGFTLALIFATTVVIIACPCSLGLATPTALMVGTGVGAKMGVLIKGGTALEEASRANTIVFDKTGTLTCGTLQVNQMIKFNQDTETQEQQQEILQWIMAAESSVEHPIAKAIAAYISALLPSGEQKQVQQPQDFVNIPGKGLKCSFSNTEKTQEFKVVIGNEAFLKEEMIETSIINTIDFETPKTLVFVAINQKLNVCFALSDQIRQESASLISYLQKKLKLQVHMLTGDNDRVAQSVASEIGIPKEHVYASCTPQQKSEKIRELQLKQRRVIMVGDGINDSAALAQSNVGIAIGSGSQIASEASDIELLNPSIVSVAYAIDLSRATYRRIIWNFIWAFGYNMICIPFAAGVFFPAYRVIIPPWVASILMVLSSLSVLISSLFLKCYRKPTVVKKKFQKLNLTKNVPNTSPPA